MIRSTCAGALSLLAVWAPATVLAQGTQPKTVTASSLPPSASAASWVCQDGRCNYRKAQGDAWADCFTSWSPTHGGWLPTRYCR